MHVTAIVPSAGGGTRLAGGLPKQYLPLAGIPLLTRTLLALRASGRVDSLILVVPPGHEARCRAEILEPFGLHADAVVPGGPIARPRCSPASPASRKAPTWFWCTTGRGPLSRPR